MPVSGAEASVLRLDYARLERPSVPDLEVSSMTAELHVKIVTQDPEHVRHWRCFHCDEVFTDRKLAADHFGDTENETPGCLIEQVEERGLLMALRRAQRELSLFYQEDSPIERALHAIDVKWMAKVREAEQQGYDKGLADADGIRRLLAESHRMLSIHAGRDVAANFSYTYGSNWRDVVKAHIAKVAQVFGSEELPK